MSATRKQPSRGGGGGNNKAQSSSASRGPGPSPADDDKAVVGGRASTSIQPPQRDGPAATSSSSSPQHASAQPREGGQLAQGQRARRKPSRSQTQSASSSLKSKPAASSSAAPSLASATPAVLPPTPTAPSAAQNPALPPSTTTVKRTVDVAPPTVGPKGIMHDKMLHINFHRVPNAQASVPTPTRVTRARKREESEQERLSQAIEEDDSDSDSPTPRVPGIFEHPLLPIKSQTKKRKPATTTTTTTTTTDSTKNPPAPPAAAAPPNAMDIDTKPPVSQPPPLTPTALQPQPSPTHPGAAAYWPQQPWSGYASNHPNATMSTTDPANSNPLHHPSPHATPKTPFSAYPPQPLNWPSQSPRVTGITPMGWTNPANASESSPSMPPPTTAPYHQQFAGPSQTSPSLHNPSLTLAHPHPPPPNSAPPSADGFVDSGPWYPWKLDTAWYEPHPTIDYYRLHEKWFPGAPTLATHPDGQHGNIIFDDGKTYPPSMFVEGRPDLEYFGMGVDPPDTLYDFVGTVESARRLHYDDAQSGLDDAAREELRRVGRPLPFITVFEDEMVALVEEFLWRRRRARWLGKEIPSLDPPPERYGRPTAGSSSSSRGAGGAGGAGGSNASPTTAPKPVAGWGLPDAMHTWNADAENGSGDGAGGGGGGEPTFGTAAEGNSAAAGGSGSGPGAGASGGSVAGQTPQAYNAYGQPQQMEYEYAGPPPSSQPAPYPVQYQTSPSQQAQGQQPPPPPSQMGDTGGLNPLNQPAVSPPPGQPPWGTAIARMVQDTASKDGTLATAWDPPSAKAAGPAPWSGPNGYPVVNYNAGAGDRPGVGPGHGNPQMQGATIAMTPQGWPPHANVGVNPSIGPAGAAPGQKVSPPAMFGEPARRVGGAANMPFGTDYSEMEDYPGGGYYAAIAEQRLQGQHQQQPQHQQNPQPPQPARPGSGPQVPPQAPMQQQQQQQPPPPPMQRMFSTPQLPSQQGPPTPALQPPAPFGPQNVNSPYQPPFDNSWLDNRLSQGGTAVPGSQPHPPPQPQRSQSQPTSPGFVGGLPNNNFHGLHLPPAPNLNVTYAGNGMHHPPVPPPFAVPPGAHPQQYYPDPAFAHGGHPGGAQPQGFTHY